MYLPALTFNGDAMQTSLLGLPAFSCYVCVGSQGMTLRRSEEARTGPTVVFWPEGIPNHL